ncbi:hypothetical protein [Microbacterium sp. bgisy203]|uniref:hypothetical protein n=1 Tax=Microbacterium sp. bgisy203 TaxID=3413799 RepID=UPI003D74B8C6
MMRARGIRRRKRCARGLAAAVFALGLATAPLPALADEGPDDVIVTVPEGEGTAAPGTGDRDLVNAQLRWALNAESGGGAFAPGTCNFLSAGIAGDSGGPNSWTEGQTDAGIPLYRTQDGAVRIEKPTASGEWTVASTANRCLDAQGRRVTTATASTSGNQVVIDRGVGTVRDGALQLRWSGSFTIVYYSGMTYWSVSDPVLTLDARGDGRLTGTASGHGADMDDHSKWEKLPSREIVLAEIRGAESGAAAGFAVTPAYLGVRIDTRAGTPQVTSGPSWGAFPQSFVDFQQQTGQHSYWYSSGGAADAKKVAAPVYISFDAAAPVTVPPPSSGEAAPATAAPSNPIRMPAAPSPEAELAAFLGPATAPITTEPQRDGLVPDATSGLPPLVPPLLAAGAALSVAIVSTMSMMRVLPWQRRAG